MAKATLESDMVEERDELDYALAGLDALLVLSDLDNELRSMMKHGAGAFAGLDEKTIERVREWVWDQRSTRNLPEVR
jgi:hypothetical protein